MSHSKKANQRSEKRADESKYGQELLQRAGGAAAAMLLISRPSRVLANDRSVWRTVIYSGNNYMKCSICGSEVSDSAGLCPSCGSSVDIGTGLTLEPEAPRTVAVRRDTCMALLRKSGVPLLVAAFPPLPATKHITFLELSSPIDTALFHP